MNRDFLGVGSGPWVSDVCRHVEQDGVPPSGQSIGSASYIHIHVLLLQDGGDLSPLSISSVERSLIALQLANLTWTPSPFSRQLEDSIFVVWGESIGRSFHNYGQCKRSVFYSWISEPVNSACQDEPLSDDLCDDHGDAAISTGLKLGLLVEIPFVLPEYFYLLWRTQGELLPDLVTLKLAVGGGGEGGGSGMSL